MLESLVLVLWIAVFISQVLSRFKFYSIPVDRIVFGVFTGIASLIYFQKFLPIIRNTGFKYFTGFVLISFIVNAYYELLLNVPGLFYNSFVILALFLFSLLSYILLTDEKSYVFYNSIHSICVVTDSYLSKLLTGKRNKGIPKLWDGNTSERIMKIITAL